MFLFSFKNRIAVNYIFSSSFLIAVVFLFIYQTVKFSVNQHINHEIQEELVKHLDDIQIDEKNTYLIQVDQWRSREHNTISVNPVFVEFYDNNKLLIDKSPNLKDQDLQLFDDSFNDVYTNSRLNGIPIRQIQTTIKSDNRVVGYLVLAMSVEDFEIVMILKKILLIAFPLILIVLFFIARFFAGRSIKPINSIIDTSNLISRENLSTRIQLPQNKDELYTLSKTINDLLDRIEKAVEREKQFTSDASHELRTPLAVIKGTLEVLVRKPRNQTEYVEKINYCVTEVDRLNRLVDELLLLARFENQKQTIKSESVYLNAVILDTLALYSQKIKEKGITVRLEIKEDYYLVSDGYLLSIVFGNLISNAVKYNRDKGQITISIQHEAEKLSCTIHDSGVGIPLENLEKIFHPFFRSHTANHPEIKGTGLGLSIVQRLCNLLKIDIEIESKVKQGTVIKLTF